MGKWIFTIFLLLSVLLFLLSYAKAGNYTQQTVNFQIEEIYAVEFPAQLSFTLDSFNWDFYENLPILVPDKVTHYYKLTFNDTAYIKSRLLNHMEPFSVISVTLEAPPRGTSFGKKELNDFTSGFKKNYQNLAYVDGYARVEGLRADYELIASIYVSPGIYYNTIEYIVVGE